MRDYSSPSSPYLDWATGYRPGGGRLAPVPAPSPVTLAVRVRPGASRTRVGGTWGEGPQAPLLVAVSARAVDGAATEAVLRAVAEALGVRRHQVRLLRGATTRDKLLEVDADPQDVAVRIAELRDGP